MQVFDMLQ